jgi:hypothetical protein
MTVLSVTEHQLHAMMPSVVRSKQVLVVRDATTEKLREVCQHHDGVEVIAPLAPIPSHEEQVILVRLLRPAQREQAMVMPYWADIPRPLLARVTQLRLVS